jgi:hypothetical protein
MKKTKKIKKLNRIKNPNREPPELWTKDKAKKTKLAH